MFIWLSLFVVENAIPCQVMSDHQPNSKVRRIAGIIGFFCFFKTKRKTILTETCFVADHSGSKMSPPVVASRWHRRLASSSRSKNSSSDILAVLRRKHSRNATTNSRAYQASNLLGTPGHEARSLHVSRLLGNGAADAKKEDGMLITELHLPRLSFYELSLYVCQVSQ